MNSKTKRYECRECGNSCKFSFEHDNIDPDIPDRCPYGCDSDWQEVPDEEAGEVATPEFKLSDKPTCPRCGLPISEPCPDAIACDMCSDPPDNTLILHYEFKPCPFCGRKPTILIDRDGDPNVGCSECACDVTIENHGIRPIGDKLRELQDRWNKRA